MLMSRLRGPVAVLLFIPGFILVAAGVCWVVVSLAGSALAQPQPPLGMALLAALPGVVAGAAGVELLLASRAVDGTRGPVRRYGRARQRARA